MTGFAAAPQPTGPKSPPAAETTAHTRLADLVALQFLPVPASSPDSKSFEARFDSASGKLFIRQDLTDPLAPTYFRGERYPVIKLYSLVIELLPEAAGRFLKLSPDELEAAKTEFLNVLRSIDPDTFERWQAPRTGHMTGARVTPEMRARRNGGDPAEQGEA